MTRRAYCVFADDVRQELGNKTSLMGIYVRSLTVQSFPVSLSRLCVCAYLITPFQEKFELLSIRIKVNDILVTEQFLPDEFLNAFWDDQQNAVNRGEITVHDDVTIAINAVISPLNIEHPGPLTVFLEVDGEQMQIGKLNILSQ